MYAIFISGGKQHKAKNGQIIRLEKLHQPIGTKIEFKQILMIIDKHNTKIGQPNIPNSYVSADIINHGKNKKIKVIKFNRRKHYRKHQGHRQRFTDVLITNIHLN